MASKRAWASVERVARLRRLDLDDGLADQGGAHAPRGGQDRVALGEIRHAQMLGETLVDPDKRVVGVVGTIQEATERTRAIEEIHRLAYYDTLTELPNRARFDANLEETLTRVIEHLTQREMAV